MARIHGAKAKAAIVAGSMVLALMPTAAFAAPQTQMGQRPNQPGMQQALDGQFGSEGMNQDGQQSPAMPDGQQPVEGEEPPALPDGEQPGDGQRPPALPNGEQPVEGEEPPALPDGEQPGDGQQPPAMPDGEQPADGEQPPSMPEGQQGQPGDGQQSQPGQPGQQGQPGNGQQPGQQPNGSMGHMRQFFEKFIDLLGIDVDQSALDALFNNFGAPQNSNQTQSNQTQG